MAVYLVAVIPLLLTLVGCSVTNKHFTKTAGYADDFVAAGKLSDLKKWWENFATLGLNMLTTPTRSTG